MPRHRRGWRRQVRLRRWRIAVIPRQWRRMEIGTPSVNRRVHVQRREFRHRQHTRSVVQHRVMQAQALCVVRQHARGDAQVFGLVRFDHVTDMRFQRVDRDTFSWRR